MRTAVEIFKEMSIGEQSATKWISDIKQAQIEAIEETVKACAEAAMIEFERYSCKTNIKSTIIGKSTYSISQKSILEVAEQLKSKL